MMKKTQKLCIMEKKRHIHGIYGCFEAKETEKKSEIFQVRGKNGREEKKIKSKEIYIQEEEKR